MKDSDNLINVREKTKVNFLKTQAQRRVFLGEYREKVSFALTKLQLIEDEVYKEVEDAIKNKKIVLLKMSREVPLNRLKPYILMAEEAGLKYELVDSINYIGEIGLVGIISDTVDSKETPVIRDVDQDFIDVGLGEVFSKNRNKKICSKCLKKVEESLPKEKKSFFRLNLLDRFFGAKCPICKQ